MLGRAAHGSPWIFRDVNYFLSHGKIAPALPLQKVRDTILAHLESLYEFYGEETGVRVARKHLGWYFGKLQDAPDVHRELMAAESSSTQFALTKESLERLIDAEATVATWGGIAACAEDSTCSGSGTERWGDFNDGENFTDQERLRSQRRA